MEPTETKSVFDYQAWQALPAVLWFLFVVIVLILFRDPLGDLVRALVSRIRSGSAIKIAGFEVEAEAAVDARPRGNGDLSTEDTRVGTRKDDGTLADARASIYAESRGLMLVHKIQRTKARDHRYDVLFYVVPHKDTSLAGVTKVEYFFGHYWGDKVFSSSDRGRGFSVVTSAYGTFLCIARAHFNDGTKIVLQRYADFEMSGYLLPPSRDV